MDIETRARVLTDGVFSWCSNGMNSSFVNDKIKSALQAVREEALEEACKESCTYCKEGRPVELGNNGKDYWHSEKDGESAIFHCSASKIRSLKERK